MGEYKIDMKLVKDFKNFKKESAILEFTGESSGITYTLKIDLVESESDLFKSTLGLSPLSKMCELILKKPKVSQQALDSF